MACAYEGGNVEKLEDYGCFSLKSSFERMMSIELI